MRYYNTSGGYKEGVVVTDDSTFFNRPNPAFDEDSGIDEPLDRRGDRPSRPSHETFLENQQAAQAAQAAAQAAASEPVFDPSTFDPSTINWGGYFDDLSIGIDVDLINELEASVTEQLSEEATTNPITTNSVEFDPSTFDPSTIDWSGYFDNASIGAGQSLTQSVAEEVSDSELIMGCTDEKAVNYDPNATVNDGLCTYQDSGNNNTETKKDNNTLKMAVAGLAVLAIFVAIKK